MGYELDDDGYEPPVRVHCPCGREMRRTYSHGKDWFTCGCGAGVRVTVPDPRFKRDQCAMWIGGARCGNKIVGGGGACGRCESELFWGRMRRPEMRKKVAESLAYEQLQRAKREAAYKERLLEAERRDANRAAESERKKLLKERAVHVVYYVRLGENHIKIGTTGRLTDRMIELRVANPDNLLAIEPGSYDLEKRRHRQFRQLQYDKRKEDFQESPDLIALTRKLRTQYGDPYTYVADQLAQRRGGDLQSA